MERKRVFSGSPYEETIGFCRAVRVGNQIVVSGTAPMTPDGATATPGDPYGQAKRCFEIIKAAIEQLGGTLNHVVRTRMYVTDLSYSEAVGRAHGEFFRNVKPAATMIGVAGLVREDFLVEIEADCIVED